METLSSKFQDIIKDVLSISKVATHITSENVYQPAELKVLPFLDKMIEDLKLPGSGIDGAENIIELFKKAKEGASCLILPEHYSNTDLPCVSYFLRHHSAEAAEAAESLVAIANMKLNEQNPQVAAFASAFSRIVICPSRYLDLINGEKVPEERLRVIQINRASMRALNEIKKQKKLVLVFPAGTRYRPWDPSSKRGVREIDSYIKSFDYMCLVAINGHFLKPREGDMIYDVVQSDVVRLKASPVIACEAFREKVKEDLAKKEGSGGAVGGEIDKVDKKQAVVDAIMAELEIMHEKNEVERQEIFERLKVKQ